MFVSEEEKKFFDAELGVLILENKDIVSHAIEGENNGNFEFILTNVKPPISNQMKCCFMTILKNLQKELDYLLKFETIKILLK